jgi:hypothetical protein
VRVEEERDARRELVNFQTRAERSFDVGDPIGERDATS